jgi:hypothetical protein
MSIVLISYVPLLVGDPMQLIPPERTAELMEGLDQLPSGAAEACLWFKHNVKSDTDYEMRPVFLMKDADNIVEHLKMWAEGKPTEWFHFHLRQKNKRYAFALMPDFDRSISRHSIAFQMRTGYPVPKNTRWTFVFRAIHFTSGPENMFLPDRQRLADPTEVGFLDISKVDPLNLDESIQKLDDAEVKWLGPFKLASNKDVLPCLDSLIEDAKEPSKISFKR